MNTSITSKVGLVISLFLLTMATGTTTGRLIYVDADANGANDGSCWANAHPQEPTQILRKGEGQGGTSGRE